MDSFSEVIDRLGIGVTAQLLGLKESHVRTLKARDSIPPTYFGLLAQSSEGQQADVTYEVLYRLHKQLLEQRSKRAKAGAPSVTPSTSPPTPAKPKRRAA